MMPTGPTTAQSSAHARVPNDGAPGSPTLPTGAPVSVDVPAFRLSLELPGGGEPDYENDATGVQRYVVGNLQLLWVPASVPARTTQMNGQHGYWHSAIETDQPIVKTIHTSVATIEIVTMPYEEGTKDKTTYTDVLAFVTWKNPPIPAQKTICLAWWRNTATVDYAAQVASTIQPT